MTSCVGTLGAQPGRAARAACLALVVALFAAACATNPPLPPAALAAPAFPDFVFPDVPAALGTGPAAERHQRGWRFLQAGDTRSAEREFSAALKRRAGFYPAEAGLGYVALAQRDDKKALQQFDRALKNQPSYVPALVGRGETLLRLDRTGDAVAAFETALAADSSLSSVQRRLEVLRFRGVQESIVTARRAAETGRYADARHAYQQAIAASPESGFLYRELGIVERRQGDEQAALDHLRKAISLDPADARAYTQIGEILAGRGELDGAIDAYSRAAGIEPSAALDERLAEVRARARVAALPPEYREIPVAATLTRAQLAALVGVHFEKLLQESARRQVVVTDSRGHWAAPWILAVLRAGVMEPFPNHTFQPRAPVRRADLAAALGRLLNLARPGRAAEWRRSQPMIADIPPRHLSYPSVSLVVAAGVLPLFENETFQPSRLVTGAEAISAIERIESLETRGGQASMREERRR